MLIQEAFIAKELGIPVIPVKIGGTDKILPPEVRFPKHGKVTVTFGKPLSLRGTGRDCRNDAPGGGGAMIIL